MLQARGPELPASIGDKAPANEALKTLSAALHATGMKDRRRTSRVEPVSGPSVDAGVVAVPPIGAVGDQRLTAEPRAIAVAVTVGIGPSVPPIVPVVAAVPVVAMVIVMGVIGLVAFAGMVRATAVVPIPGVGAATVSASSAAMGNMTAAMAAAPVVAAAVTTATPTAAMAD